MPKYIFIDTNILLDFYRVRNETRASFLESIESIKDKIITTDTVEMEFKKGRHKAIREGLSELKSPNKIPVPGLLEKDKSAKGIETNQNQIDKQIAKLKQRIDRALENPSRSDKVFQVLQRIFKKNQKIDLHRKRQARFDIRELAQKRFILGYPPRKAQDTSIGDAINWEWIVSVAKENNADIWIVSRDSDYGFIDKEKGYLNDWLRQEFHERVGKHRKITLCPKLTKALKEFEITVTPEDEAAETRLIETSSARATARATGQVFIIRKCVICESGFIPAGNETVCSDCGGSDTLD